MALALVMLLSEAAHACPGCKEAVAAQKGGANLVAGFQYSIVFMMAMPFTILGPLQYFVPLINFGLGVVLLGIGFLYQRVLFRRAPAADAAASGE